MSDTNDDALAGCAAILAVLAIVGTIIASLVVVYLSVLAGKLFNCIVRVVFGWTLSRSSSRRYVVFCTLAVLFLVPILTWGGLLIYSLSNCSGFGQFAVVICSTLGLIGYYAGHFGISPDKLSWLQAAVVSLDN